MQLANAAMPAARKSMLAPQPPDAPLPRRRSTMQPPAFPVSNAHLLLPTTVDRGDQRRGSTRRLNRAVRKSMYDDDDDDEFHTATDDDDTEDESDDCPSMTSDGSVTMASGSDKTVMLSARPVATRSVNPSSRATSGLHRKNNGGSASGSGGARNSSFKRPSSSNNYAAVQLRPKPLTRPQKAAHLAIDIPDVSADKSRQNNHDTDKDGKLRTPVGSPGFNAQGTSTADYSGYIQKKSLAQGMMDLALLSANINQMRYLLEYKDNQPYFATSFTLVVTSLLLQIGVSLTLIWNIRFNVKKRDEMKEADRVNNIGVMGIFLVTVINVALSTFGGAPAPKEILIGGGSVGGGLGGLLPDLDGAGSGDGSSSAVDPMIYT